MSWSCSACGHLRSEHDVRPGQIADSTDTCSACNCQQFGYSTRCDHCGLLITETDPHDIAGCRTALEDHLNAQERAASRRWQF